MILQQYFHTKQLQISLRQQAVSVKCKTCKGGDSKSLDPLSLFFEIISQPSQSIWHWLNNKLDIPN